MDAPTGVTICAQVGPASAAMQSAVIQVAVLALWLKTEKAGLGVGMG
jgi:hypothetical protein